MARQHGMGDLPVEELRKGAAGMPGEPTELRCGCCAALWVWAWVLSLKCAQRAQRRGGALRGVGVRGAKWLLGAQRLPLSRTF